MKLSIKLFGPEARAVGSGELVVEVAALPIGCDALRRRVAEVEPNLAKLLMTARFAINYTFVNADHMIGADDEVAIINQVCGG
jgi:molybdopterin converting factor small subunit